MEVFYVAKNNNINTSSINCFTGYLLINYEIIIILVLYYYFSNSKTLTFDMISNKDDLFLLNKLCKISS